MQTKNYELYNNDCIDQLKKTESNTFDFSVFSPPFAELYTYSDDIRDMGNSKDYNQFFNHFDFLTPELYRTLKPGRLIAVHCMDVSLQKGKDGVIGLNDFSGDLIRAFKKCDLVLLATRAVSTSAPNDIFSEISVRFLLILSDKSNILLLIMSDLFLIVCSSKLKEVS